MDFQVDSNCIGCGACVRDCPMGVLELVDGRPTVRGKKAEGCIDCRHCVAVCPTGAAKMNGVSAADGVPLADMELPSATAMRNSLLSRRSIRQYADTEFSRAEIDGFLDTLKHVPTGCNVRHLTFRVISSRAKMEELRERIMKVLLEKEESLPPFLKGVVIAIRKHPGLDPFFRGAPHLLIVEAGPGAVCAESDCVAACAYFDMLMQGSGYGTTWCGFLNIIVNAVPEVAEFFNLPKGAAFFSMLFGNPAVKYARTVARPDGARVEYM